MMRRVLKFIGIGIALLIVIVQLIPVDRNNPTVTREIDWDSPETRVLAQRACMDCHSNETVWPWYAYIAPVSWRVADHVEHGRRHLNFSEWDSPNEDAGKIVEVIINGEMPLSDYLLGHPEAKLSADEAQQLIEGLERTLANDPPLER